MVSEREEERNREEVEEQGGGRGGRGRLLGGCGEPQCHLVAGIETAGGSGLFYFGGGEKSPAQILTAAKTHDEGNKRGGDAFGATPARLLGSLFVQHFARSH